MRISVIQRLKKKYAREKNSAKDKRQGCLPFCLLMDTKVVMRRNGCTVVLFFVAIIMCDATFIYQY